MRIIYRSFSVILLLISSDLFATEGTVIESFTIMPGICVVAKNTRCKQNIIFQWQLNKAVKSCLYKAKVKKPLHCSSELKTLANFTLNVEKENEFIVQLTQMPKVRIHKRIIIRELSVDVRQSRKHLWSVF